MNSERPSRPNGVIGPTGKPLTVDNLPSPETKRWVMSRKAEVVAAVRRDLIGRNEACDRCGISDEELLSWERLIDAHGLRGLQTTRLQQYRGRSPRITDSQDGLSLKTDEQRKSSFRTLEDLGGTLKDLGSRGCSRGRLKWREPNS